MSDIDMQGFAGPGLDKSIRHIGGVVEEITGLKFIELPRGLIGEIETILPYAERLFTRKNQLVEEPKSEEELKTDIHQATEALLKKTKAYFDPTSNSIVVNVNMTSKDYTMNYAELAVALVKALQYQESNGAIEKYLFDLNILQEKIAKKIVLGGQEYFLAKKALDKIENPNDQKAYERGQETLQRILSPRYSERILGWLQCGLKDACEKADVPYKLTRKDLVIKDLRYNDIISQMCDIVESDVVKNLTNPFNAGIALRTLGRFVDTTLGVRTGYGLMEDSDDHKSRTNGSHEHIMRNAPENMSQVKDLCQAIASCYEV
jgi:hypothetical protein